MTLSWKRLTALALLCIPLAAEAQGRRGQWQRDFPPALEGNELDAATTKQALENILKAYPPSLTEVLRLDPSLLTNTAYLAPYPTLVNFLKDHTVVTHNPAYFLGAPSRPEPRPQIEYIYRDRDPEFVGAFLVILGLMGIVGWMIRAVVDHQRWLKTSRTHSETQSKILDRFASNEELLNFIQTPAGKSFLESPAPPARPRSVEAPIQQILWSVKAGVVLFAGGIGLQSAGLYPIIRTLLMAVGVGFILSALSSWVLSKRLGLLESTNVTSQTPPS